MTKWTRPTVVVSTTAKPVEVPFWKRMGLRAFCSVCQLGHPDRPVLVVADHVTVCPECAAVIVEAARARAVLS